ASILEFFDRTDQPTKAAISLRHALEDSLAAGRPLNRDGVLAQVAALRSMAPPTETARLAFVVQSMYYTLGVRSHPDCSLFPGPFAYIMQRPGIVPIGLHPPSIDWEAEPTRVARGLEAGWHRSIPPVGAPARGVAEHQ